jgi:hypothetical protein
MKIRIKNGIRSRIKIRSRIFGGDRRNATEGHNPNPSLTLALTPLPNLNPHLTLTPQLVP